MDGGRENCFLAGGAEISRRGGGITAALFTQSKSPDAKRIRASTVPDCFHQTAARQKSCSGRSPIPDKLVDDPQLHRRVCAVHKITDGGLRYAAFHIKLILRHATLLHQLNQTPADGFIQLQVPHLPYPVTVPNYISHLEKISSGSCTKEGLCDMVRCRAKGETIRMTLPHPCKTPMGKVF